MKPLNLPEPLKVAARLVRDTPFTNLIISGSLKPLGGSWAAHRVPRLGSATAVLPNGKTMRMWADEAELVQSLVHYHGWTGDEPETLPLWFELATKSKTIIDVGAHVGHMTIVAALANPDAKVHAFEPHPRVREILERNIRLNELANVTVHGCALGRAAGTATLFAMSNGVPSCSGLSELGTAAESFEVQVKTLDEVLPDAAGPVLLKVDTETTEPDVLAGGRELIIRTKPTIIVEVWPKHEVELPGYQPFLMTDTGLQKRDRAVGVDGWRNYLLRPLP